MRRRRATSRKPAKAQQTVKVKRGAAPKAARNRRLSALSSDAEIARLARELAEAREQQAATSKVLQVISRSPGELEPVFRAMLANAVRLCEANFGTLFLYDGDLFRPAAMRNLPPALSEFMQQRGAFHPPPGDPARSIIANQTTGALSQAGDSSR